MARIRIAQRGLGPKGQADLLDDVTHGVQCHWIEIDGHRIEDIIAVEFRSQEGDVTRVTATVELFGPIEIVYLGREGNELGWRETSAAAMSEVGRVDCDSVIEVPAP